ncbi:hypothetical protein BWR59_01815 [Pseudomonas sp. Bc-h]|uniref:hypothetical protein n=1 Tax=Pseudomonas sp. Bc-h TaxID=1943632 RepID=UPI0009DB4F5B|nr:hypothetical protein [Pseudomonas sp. Bc-h]OQR37856.1 hypothetical protein BWR59_01815 [Pseudomonas sp. Bc-h]
MTTPNESLVMGSSLVSFGSSVSAGLRADVMDCLLYAQLSADKKYDRRQNWRQWIEQYQRVIYQKGSRISGALNPVQIKIQRLQDLRTVRYYLSGAATSPELQALLERSIDALMGSEHAKAFFSTWFVSGRSESMQVIPCEARADGGVNILVCGLQMTTSAFTSGFFFWEVPSGEMIVRSNGASFMMTEESYAPFRKPIARYLGAQARRVILEL